MESLRSRRGAALRRVFGIWVVCASFGTAPSVGADGADDAAPAALRLESAAPARSSDGVLIEHLGVAVGQGRMAPILRVGRPCAPCERTVDYSTALDDQTEIPIVLLRGRGTGRDQVTPVAALLVGGLSPRPAGAHHVRVTIGIEGADVRVAARDAASGRALPVVRVDPDPRAASGRSSAAPASR